MGVSKRCLPGICLLVLMQAPVYAQVVLELASGQKRSHWMWFIFPQLRALGRSATARHFGMAAAAEALAYWEHPLLGPRLAQCTNLVLAIEGRSALQIFGPPDDLKFASSMTLFECATGGEALFTEAIDKFFGGRRDERTLALR